MEIEGKLEKEGRKYCFWYVGEWGCKKEISEKDAEEAKDTE